MLSGEQAIELRAPASAVWTVIADVERHPEWQPTVRRLDVLERDGDGRVMRTVSEHDAKVTTLRVVLGWVYEPQSRLAWHRVEGDVKAMNGSLEVHPLGAAACRVVYHLEIDPGRRLGLLLRGPVVDQVRQHVLGRTLEGLQRRIGA